jgi:hypothetical protein
MPTFSDISLIINLLLVFNKARALSFLYSCSLAIVRDVLRFPQKFDFFWTVVSWVRLMEPSQKAILIISCVSMKIFPCFLTNLIAHSLFRFLDHSEFDEDTPVSIWDHMRLRETTARVLSATRPRYIRARSEGDASLGALSYRRTNCNPYAFWTYLVRVTRYAECYDLDNIRYTEEIVKF